MIIPLCSIFVPEVRTQIFYILNFTVQSINTEKDRSVRPSTQKRDKRKIGDEGMKQKS